MRRLLFATGIAILAATYAKVWTAERVQRRQGLRERTARADAMVVFGGKCYERGPSIEVRERLDHAVWLWGQGVAPMILASGGTDEDVDEVDVMLRYVLARGVPPASTGPARPGDNTRLTISGLAPDTTYVAVSSAYHAHRIAAESRRQRKQVIVDCAPDSIDLRSHRVLRVRRMSEVAGSLMYASPEWLAQPARRALGRGRHSIPELFTPHS